MKKEIVCIVCPNGCDLTIIADDNILQIEGALCKRGEEYAYSEMTNPMRMFTTSVLVDGGEVPLVSVRTTEPIPKDLAFDFIASMHKIHLKAPVQIGQIIMRKVCGCDSNVIATKNVQASTLGDRT